MHHEKILQKLQPWLDQGYQVEGEIGANAVKIHLAKKYKLPFDIIDVMMWIMTFGFAYLIERWSGDERIFAVYRPIEFRLRLYCPDERIQDEVPMKQELELVPA